MPLSFVSGASAEGPASPEEERAGQGQLEVQGPSGTKFAADLARIVEACVENWRERKWL